MLSIFSLLCFATLFSFINPTSTVPSNSPVSHVNLSRTLQKSSSFCDTDAHDCSTSLGADSTCVDGVCVCDIGYKKDRRSPDTFACMRIDCQFDSDCPQANTECSYGSCSCKSGYWKDFKTASCTDYCKYSYECTESHTKCDTWSNHCVCEDAYKKKESGLGCVKVGCTYSSDCSGMNTRCDDASKECVCDDGYERSLGSCIYTYDHRSSSSGSGVGIGFAIVGFIVLATVSIVWRLACRAQRHQSRRVVNGTEQQTTAPVPSVPQAELIIPAGYQAGYQPQAPVFLEPYGNLQDTPPPPYSETYSPPTFQFTQTHPQPAVQPPTDQQPSAPKI